MASIGDDITRQIIKPRRDATCAGSANAVGQVWAIFGYSLTFLAAQRLEVVARAAKRSMEIGDMLDVESAVQGVCRG